ncbi:AAR160Wp [Eremothecium gossypii ATCC 10895]|uniref:Ubiquitin-like protein ATG12 n=1 Tax=Eremothecium gossypii (strain ATCC 10895 / CBS 109.51 / FGSC 9923 / NRRL Y-1056) TaxID=284811 RepID=ATG12_EREGS|nr:AAR160Wp [Eremothecium gossypii ATCC 10895]Q75EB4.1 RecName: Full=Ubiquitin-like protein ATG12; AltName: Full=Autophagy-related protein 12 [Eremothecium gossypii ATCC 10895]AAS50527.1 AAR160Wp [Eremothecium gossypii ATCC 10895]AEY94814.1 FAAR160Wp [Eremothecium gossypii FDAG1]
MVPLLESETENSISQSQFDSESASAEPTPPQHTQESLQNRLEEYHERLSRLQLPSSSDSECSDIEQESLELEQEVPLSTSVYLAGARSAGGLPSSSELSETPEPPKVAIRFQPIGSVGQVMPQVCRISSAQSFGAVLVFLRRRLRLDTVHCYVSNSFAPTPQQNVGQLWEQFKVNDELVVSYCATVAFG